MAIITLTSDWGLKDYYAGAVKGAILRQFPGAQIVDISLQVPAFDLSQAAFIVRNSYRNFPEGSIHIIAINGEAAIDTPHTLVKHHGQFFIGADNGIFSLIFDEKPEQILELDIIQDSDYFTFPARDLFVKVACHIASGKPIAELGHPKEKLVQKMAFQPVIQGDLIKGKVIYVDNYENVFVNITEALFNSATKGKKFVVTFRSPSYRITEISKSYKDVNQGEMLAIFSTSGYLEIAIREGKASSLLGLKMDQLVIIELGIRN
ncbi:MAG: SAM-dependent chlorinase/fluorinase [Bacteroidota bacterium]